MDTIRMPGATLQHAIRPTLGQEGASFVSSEAANGGLAEMPAAAELHQPQDPVPVLVDEFILVLGSGSEELTFKGDDGITPLEKLHDKARARGLTLRIVGDPITGTTRQALKALQGNIKPLTPAAFYGHGITHDGVHKMRLGGSTASAKELPPSTRVVRALRKAGVSIVSVFSCHAGAAARNVASDPRLMTDPGVLVSLHGGPQATGAGENVAALFELVEYYSTCLAEKRLPGNVENFVFEQIRHQDQCLRVVVPSARNNKKGLTLHIPRAELSKSGADVLQNRIERLRIEDGLGEKGMFPNREKRVRKALLKQGIETPLQAEHATRVFNQRFERVVFNSKKSRLAAIDDFLAKGANPKCLNEIGDCVLFEAIAMNHDDCARLLNHPGVLPLGKTECQAALRSAVRENRPRLFSWLLKRPEFDLVSLRLDLDGSPLLCRMATQNQAAMADDLLQIDPSQLNRADAKGMTPLHHAIASKSYKVFRLLSAHPGTDLNAGNMFGQTPLHLAIANNDRRALRVLLRNDRIDANRANWNGDSPLVMAVKHCRFEIARALVRSGKVDLEAVDAKGGSAADHAKKSRDPRIRELLNG